MKTNAKAALKKYWGYDEYRPAQEEVINRILKGESLIVIQSTGAGKSLCYQLPALIMEGYTIVVSPLISLMKDQVDKLQELNIPAEFINSTTSTKKNNEIIQSILNNKTKILYVAPERFQQDSFKNFVKNNPPVMLVIDEVHVMSENGHDFRPAFIQLGDIIAECGIKQVCGFTATATKKVKEDIIKHLQVPNIQIIEGELQRNNLSFSVVQNASEIELFSILQRFPNRATIVYVRSRLDAESYASRTNSLCYHAGMTKTERAKTQDKFINQVNPIIFCTSAFALGIDRADIRLVINCGAPEALEAYFQCAGRVSRDGAAGDCILLNFKKDAYISKFLIEKQHVTHDLVKEVYLHLKKSCIATSDGIIEKSQKMIMDQVDFRINDHSKIGVALKLLKRYKYLTFREKDENKGTLQLYSDPKNIRKKYESQNSVAAHFIINLLDHLEIYNFSNLNFTNAELSEITGLKLIHIKRVLPKLISEIHWIAPFSGNAIQILKFKDNIDDIDFKEINQNYHLKLEKLSAMNKYIKTTDCRQKNILNYFGQYPDNYRCNVCDNCKGEKHLRGYYPKVW